MTIRQKTLAIFTITSLFLILLFISFVNVVLVGGFSELEQKMLKTDVERASNGVRLELGTLETMLADWAPWDDTYTYMNTRDEKYVSSNLVDSTFIAQKLNLLVFLDNAGMVVYAQGFDLTTKSMQPISDEVFALLWQGSPLLKNTDVEKHVSGLVKLTQGPMLIASRPITDSAHAMSPNGTLVVGRYLDEGVLERINDAVQLKIQVYPFHSDSPGVPVGAPPFTDTRIQAVNNSQILGETVLRDIFGLPVALLQVEQQRLIHRQGEVTKRILLGAIILVGVVFIALVMHLMEKNVLERLALLSRQVSILAKNQDLTSRLSVVGQDELSLVAGNINTMLIALEKSQERLLYMARHDSLTGLYSRAYFEQRIKQLLPTEKQYFIAVV